MSSRQPDFHWDSVAGNVNTTVLDLTKEKDLVFIIKSIYIKLVTDANAADRIVCLYKELMVNGSTVYIGQYPAAIQAASLTYYNTFDPNIKAVYISSSYTRRLHPCPISVDRGELLRVTVLNGQAGDAYEMHVVGYWKRVSGYS